MGDTGLCADEIGEEREAGRSRRAGTREESQQEAKSPGRVGEAPRFGVPTVPGTMAAALYP